jgi:predicted PhzF superfamily epimerase YddE/YHI9
VFSAVPAKGNGLAIVVDGDGLTDEQIKIGGLVQILIEGTLDL